MCSRRTRRRWIRVGVQNHGIAPHHGATVTANPTQTPTLLTQKQQDSPLRGFDRSGPKVVFASSTLDSDNFGLVFMVHGIAPHHGASAACTVTANPTQTPTLLTQRQQDSFLREFDRSGPRVVFASSTLGSGWCSWHRPSPWGHGDSQSNTNPHVVDPKAAGFSPSGI